MMRRHMMRRHMMPRNGLPSEEVLRAALDQSGYAVIPSLVDDQACAALPSMYDGAADRFRSTVTMASRKSAAVRVARSA